MHKYILTLGFIILAVTIGATGAAAGPSTVDLNMGTLNTVTFTTGILNTGMAVGGTTGGVGGNTGLLTTVNSWSITPGASLVLTPALNPLASGLYSVTSTVPLTITLKNGSTAVLIGDLTFPSTPTSFVTLLSNATLTLNANFTVTGGSLCLGSLTCPSTSNTAQLTVTLSPYNGTDFKTGNILGGNVVIGDAASIGVTPEPTSMLLFGTGLLAFGGILRRKLLT